MKILLIEDVDTLGYKGEIFDVAPGYGRNYLIPQGLAVPATAGQLKQAEVWRDQAAARREQLRKEHAALIERLANARVRFEAKAGEKGRLYGSITTAEIAARLEEMHGIEIDRRKITVPGKALREIGLHTALVRLDADFQANVQVEVVDEEAAKAAAEKTAEDEAAGEDETVVSDEVGDSAEIVEGEEEEELDFDDEDFDFEDDY